MSTDSKRIAGGDDNDEANKRQRTDEEIRSVEEAAVRALDADDAADLGPHVKRLSAAAQVAVTDPQEFDHYLFKLLLYKAAHNNFQVSRDKEPELHAWLKFLKQQYKFFLSSQEAAPENQAFAAEISVLSADQFKVLQSLHVPLTSRGDDHWNRFFGLLTDYKETHGHVLVPRLCETPGLGDWVTDQRRQYKAWKQGQPSQLSKDRRDKLADLGFAWQVRNRPEWDQRYKELLEYKEKNGDCKVPQHYKQNKALGKWVAKQREVRLCVVDAIVFLTSFTAI